LQEKAIKFLGGSYNRGMIRFCTCVLIRACGLLLNQAKLNWPKLIIMKMVKTIVRKNRVLNLITRALTVIKEEIDEFLE